MRGRKKDSHWGYEKESRMVHETVTVMEKLMGRKTAMMMERVLGRKMVRRKENGEEHL